MSWLTQLRIINGQWVTCWLALDLYGFSLRDLLNGHQKHRELSTSFFRSAGYNIKVYSWNEIQYNQSGLIQ